MRVAWTARRSNQSILKEINPGISLEEMMLKLRLQYFGHLMRRVDSLEKTLMLGGIGSRRRRGRPRSVCVCLCVCVKGGTQAHPSPILSLLDPGDLKWRVAQKGNPGPGLLRRGNPGSRVVGTSWSLQEKLGGSGRAEGRPPVSFLQLFVKCSPSQNLLGHSTCSTEYASTPPHPGFSTLHSCQPCLPASLWDAIHLGICSSPPNHPHPPT